MDKEKEIIDRMVFLIVLEIRSGIIELGITNKQIIRTVGREGKGRLELITAYLKRK